MKIFFWIQKKVRKNLRDILPEREREHHELKLERRGARKNKIWGYYEGNAGTEILSLTQGWVNRI